MARKNLKSALGNSIEAEEQSIRNRFDKADNLFKDIKATPAKNNDPESKKEPHKTVIRDSFSLPEFDYELIEVIKQRCLKKGVSVTKSEIVRAGFHCLNAQTDDDLVEFLQRLEKVKVGRPK